MLIKGKIKNIDYNEIADILMQQKFAIYENKTFIIFLDRLPLSKYNKVT